MFILSNIEFGQSFTIHGMPKRTQFLAKNMFINRVMYIMFYKSIMIMSSCIRVKW